MVGDSGVNVVVGVSSEETGEDVAIDIESDG